MKWELTINAPTIISFLALMLPLIYRVGGLIAEMRANRALDEERWKVEHEWRTSHETSDQRNFDKLYDLVRGLTK